MSIAGAKIDIVVLVVLNGEQTEDILFGFNGVVQHIRPGTVFLSCATLSQNLALKLGEKCAQSGSVKTSEGNLTVMASGFSSCF